MSKLPASTVVLVLLGGCGSVAPGTCSEALGVLTCAANSDRVGEPGHQRRVMWQVPQGDPPEGGWPVVLLFQGSLAPAPTFWTAFESEPLGAIHQVELVQRLLGDGFAVFTPLAVAGGWWCWNTNVPPWAARWEDSPDKSVMDVLFDRMDAGDFGPLDTTRMYASGISSGGYMTSRMAEAYPGRFSALAIVSASWATCVGTLCELPDELPADHPPTFFGHGAKDMVVPPRTMLKYRDALDDMGVETSTLIEPMTGHAWFEGEAEAIAGWFEGH